MSDDETLAAADSRRILFYAVNGLGLGHVTRLLAIARQMRRLEPQHQYLFLTSSEADGVIYQEGFAAFKVPSKTIRAETGLQSGLYAKMVQSLTWNAIATFDPTLLVVDTFPTGSLQELLPVMRWQMRTAFVYRAQKTERALSPGIQQVLPLYDRIIVPHEPGSEEVPMPPDAARHAAWVGPILIREPGELLDRETARRELGLAPHETVVYASFGGGGDQAVTELMTTVAAALPDRPDLRLVVAPGPLYRGPLPERAGLLRLDRYPILPYLRAFDLAIGGAGYNTANELRLSGVPSILVARDRGVDDQFARAQRFEAEGVCRAVALDEPQALALAVTGLLARTARPGAGANGAAGPSGAERAARVLLGLLS